MALKSKTKNINIKFDYNSKETNEKYVIPGLGYDILNIIKVRLEDFYLIHLENSRWNIIVFSKLQVNEIVLWSMKLKFEFFPFLFNRIIK